MTATQELLNEMDLVDIRMGWRAAGEEGKDGVEVEATEGLETKER